MNLKLKVTARTSNSEEIVIFDADTRDENNKAVNLGKLDVHYVGDQIVGTLLIWQEYATGFNRTHAPGSDETMDSLIDEILSEISEPLGVPVQYGIEVYYPSVPSVDVPNREKRAGVLGMPLVRTVGCQQVHGSEVALVRAEDAGRGMCPDRPSMQGADGMVTNAPGIYLMALSADCPPVFLYDPVRKATGLAHSGWKGTAARIASNAVGEMSRPFGSEPEDI